MPQCCGTAHYVPCRSSCSLLVLWINLPALRSSFYLLILYQFFKSIQNGFQIFKHSDLTRSFLGLVKFHSNILVFLDSVDCHLASSVFKNTFIFLLQWPDQFFVDLRFDMADLAVINIPAYSLMVVVNCAVGNAWIIWVDLEPKVIDCVAELSII